MERDIPGFGHQWRLLPKGDIRLGASENASAINKDNKVTFFLSGIERPALGLSNGVSLASQFIDMVEKELLVSKMTFPLSHFTQ